MFSYRTTPKAGRWKGRQCGRYDLEVEGAWSYIVKAALEAISSFHCIYLHASFVKYDSPIIVRSNRLCLTDPSVLLFHVISSPRSSTSALDPFVWQQTLCADSFELQAYLIPHLFDFLHGPLVVFHVPHQALHIANKLLAWIWDFTVQAR